MGFVKVRVKVEEPFKDGNILEGRFLKTGEILVLDENIVERIIQSGGILTIMEKMIPNPMKTPALAEAIVAQENQELQDEKAKDGELKNARETQYRQEAVDKREALEAGEDVKKVETAPKKPGRPRKNG